MSKERPKELLKIDGVSKESRLAIRKVFGCCQSVVSDALNGKRDTRLTRKIRTAAIRGHGGYYLLPVNPRSKVNGKQKKVN